MEIYLNVFLKGKCLLSLTLELLHPLAIGLLLQLFKYLLFLWLNWYMDCVFSMKIVGLIPRDCIY